MKTDKKTIAIIIMAIIIIGGVGYFGYKTIFADGYTKGYIDGGNYIINYQSSNQKVFLTNGTDRFEIPFAQLCGGQNG